MIVGVVDDFVDGAARRVMVDGVAVCVVRVGADFYAVGDTCSHADFSLADGDVWSDDLEIECPKHGATFSLVSGEPQTLPATQPVPTFVVALDGEHVVVEPR